MNLIDLLCRLFVCTKGDIPNSLLDPIKYEKAITRLRQLELQAKYGDRHIVYPVGFTYLGANEVIREDSNLTLCDYYKKEFSYVIQNHEIPCIIVTSDENSFDHEIYPIEIIQVAID